MANWACLPHDLLVLTAGLLKKFEDFAAFGTVCKSWHAAANKDYFKELWLRERTPYLLLPSRINGNDDEVRDLYSWSEGDVVASIRVSNSSKRKCFESLGWLLAIDEDGSMSLLNPFSKVEIPLPHQSTFGQANRIRKPYEFVRRMVLSARPDESSNYTVVIIYRCVSDLAFWRPGETSWYTFETVSGFYQDVTYHSGRFYTFDSDTSIRVYNFVEGNPPESRVIAHIAHVMADHTEDLQKELLAPSKNIYITKNFEDSLLIVTRAYDEDYNKTIKFRVYEFNVSMSTWREIDSLGNMAIFVSSLNATTAVDASRYPGVIKANHIYFMDDGNPWDLDIHFESVSGKDMGTYNMENGTVVPFYLEEEFDSIICRPTWFIPISWPLSC